MENDNNNELDIQNETVEETEQTTTTEEDTVDYKALYEQEKSDKKKLERKLFSVKASSKPLTEKPQVDDETVKTVQRLALLEEKRQFGFDNGLSPEETDAVYKFSSGNPTKETLEHPFVKAGIESLRSQKKLESNIPGSTSRSPIFSDKNFAEMTDDERRSSFEQASKKFKK